MFDRTKKSNWIAKTFSKLIQWNGLAKKTACKEILLHSNIDCEIHKYLLIIKFYDLFHGFILPQRVILNPVCHMKGWKLLIYIWRKAVFFNVFYQTRRFVSISSL